MVSFIARLLDTRIANSPLALFGLAALTTGACYGTWDWPLAPSTRVGGNFTSIESVHIKAGDRAGRISPLCGCEAEFPQPFWDGLVFARKRVSVDFRDPGDRPYYLGISATESKPITPFGYLHMAAYFHVRGRDGVARTIGPKRIAGLSLVVDDRFQITPNGEFPQLAMLPSTGAEVDVKLGDRDALLLSSRLDKSGFGGLGADGKFDPDEVNSLDVLGPSISIDFTRPPLGINGNGAESKAAFQGLVDEIGFLPSQVDRIDLVVPFAARFSFMQLDFPNGLPKVAGSNDGSEIWGGAGRLSITGNDAVDPEEYQAAQDVVSRNRRIWSRQYRDMTDEREESMRYRMPFIAPRLGYQVYGEQRTIKLKSVSGGITLGSLDVPISGSADLEFQDISPLIDDPDLPSAPLQFDVGREGELRFVANSKVKVNNEEIVASKYTIGGVIGILGAILTVLTGAIQILTSRKSTEN